MAIPPQDGCVIQFGPFELDPKNRELRRNGVPVPIQPAAFRLLEMLVSRSGELLTREEIRQKLWPEEKLSKTESLDLRLNFEIKSVREALNEDRMNPRYIQTVRKRGYKFNAPVQVMLAGGQAGAYRRDQNEPAGPGRRDEPDDGNERRNSSLNSVLVAGLAIVVVSLTVIGLRSHAANRPVITSVTPIQARPDQTIVIQGRGLGSYTNFTALDTPFLAIRDQTAHWAAGRIMERNWDEVTLTVTRWLNSEIDVKGFHGPYGQTGWKLSPGDEIEVAVWNPQTGAGPALYHIKVSQELTQGKQRDPIRAVLPKPAIPTASAQR